MMSSDFDLRQLDVTIQHEHGHFVLHLPSFALDYPIVDMRKVYKIWADYMYYELENVDQLNRMKDWFAHAIRTADDTWQYASKDYANGFRIPDKELHKNVKDEINRNNQRLKDAVTQKKKRLEKLKHRQEIFLEFFKDFLE